MDLIKEKELRAEKSKLISDTLEALMHELIMEDVVKPEKKLAGCFSVIEQKVQMEIFKGHTEELLKLVTDRLAYAMNKSNKRM